VALKLSFIDYLGVEYYVISTPVLLPGASGCGTLSTSSSSSSSSSNSSQQSAATGYRGPQFSESVVSRIGERISFTGKRLTDVTEVWIDGKQIDFEIISDTEIQLDLPDLLAAGTFDLKVKSSHGILVFQNALTVAPFRQEVVTLYFPKGYKSADVNAELASLGAMFGEATKFTCLVNKADFSQSTAKDLCSYLTSGSGSDLSPKVISKETYSGLGLWLRVWINY
jgi:hypothetical protein